MVDPLFCVPRPEVSWQVTGIRQDAYAEAHRIPNEETKPAEEQGHYLHPELFGAPPEMSVSAVHRSAAAASAAAKPPAVDQPQPAVNRATAESSSSPR